MRRMFTTLAVAALLTGLVAAPAVADVPDEFTESFSFEDTNPCSGELITLSFNNYVSIHEHDDAFIVRVKRTGTTSVAQGRFLVVDDGVIFDESRASFSGIPHTYGFGETGDSVDDQYVHSCLGQRQRSGERFGCRSHRQPHADTNTSRHP